MARIRPYESQISTQADLPARNAQPSDFGGPGVQNLGEGLQSFGGSMGQVQRFMQEQEARKQVTDASVGLTELGTELVKEHDAAAKNWKPGDAPLSESFLGVVKARIDQLRGPDGENDRFTTQAGLDTFKTHAAHLVNHLTGLTQRTDAHLAGEAAVAQHRQLVDTTGNFLQAHPAYFSLRREEVASIINDPNGVYGQLPAVKRQDLIRLADEQLAISAVQGFIRKTPNVALQTLNDPMLKQDEQYGWIAQYIPNEKMQPLIQRAETEVQALDVERARVTADENRQRIALARESEAGLVEKIALHMDDPKQPMLSARDVLDSKLMQLDPDKGKALLSLIHAWSKEDPHKPTHTDPSTMRGLVRDIHREDGDPRKMTDNQPIYDAYDKGLLSFQDLKHLSKEFDDQRTPDGQRLGQTKEKFIAAIAPQIDHSNPMMGRMDRSGKANVYAFEQMVTKKVEQYRKEGKDVYSLFDPNEPDYLGKPQRVQPFQKHLMESMEEIANQMNRGAAKSEAAPSTLAPATPAPNKQRLPGETPQQYLDRMKKS